MKNEHISIILKASFFFGALFVLQAIILFATFLFNGSEDMAIGAAVSLAYASVMGGPGFSNAISPWIPTTVDENTTGVGL